MNKASLTQDLVYNTDKPAITVLLKTESSKEIRIAMKAGQLMKEHKAPFPIVIEIFEGVVDFGVADKRELLKKGDIISLDANVPHDLNCVEDCIVRLSLALADKVERVKEVVKD